MSFGSMSLPGLRPPDAADRQQDGPAAGFLPRRPGDECDRALVSRCRAADDDAWAELVRRFSRYVRTIATSYGLDAADAEDVGQEVFARVYEQLDRLRDDSAIRPWLAQITRRLAIDRLRADARLRAAGDVEATGESTDADPGLQRVEEMTTIRQALAVLPDDCRDALDRFFTRDQSYRMIAQATSVPIGTVGSRISRGLERLRDELGCA